MKSPHVTTNDREKLRQYQDAFYKGVPKARKIDPFFQTIFAFMWEAGVLAKPGTRVLNIYKSDDMSGGREEVYKETFFKDCDLVGVDLSKDTFTYNGVPSTPRHSLPFPDNHFAVVVTTKYITEHVTEPYDVLKEIHRVLKPGGEAFIVAAHVRRQHQVPYDYFRMTEYALEYLAKKVGFSSYTIEPTDGAMYTLAMYSYFFQRAMPFPKFLERFFDGVFYYVTCPIFFFLHRLDSGYGRDLSSYFTLRAKK